MNEFVDSEEEYRAQLAPPVPLIPVHAGTRLLIAIGVGLAVGALVHALQPAPKPQQKLKRLLEDMEDSLREISAPALNKVGGLASDGAHAMTEKLHRGEAQVEKFLRSATRRFRELIS